MIEDLIERCEFINNTLILEQNSFTMQNLCSRQWYLTVFLTFFPYLNQKTNNISMCNSEGAAIDKLLQLLVDQQIISPDFLNLKGDMIASGDIASITYLIKLFEALLSEVADRNSSSTKHVSSQSRSIHSVQGIQNEFSPDQQEYFIQQSSFNQQKIESQAEPSLQSIENNKILQKCKSEKHLIRPQSTLYKNHQKNLPLKCNSLKQKKLVTHLKKQVCKKKINKNLTNTIKKQVSKTKMALKKCHKVNFTNQKIADLTKKQQQLVFRLRQFKRNKKNIKQITNLKRNKKCANQLQSLLKWKQQKINVQKKELQTNILNTLKSEQQRYVRYINKLILKLEKEKYQDYRKQFKKQMKEKDKQAKLKLIGLEQRLTNELSLIKESKQNQKAKNQLLVTGHKQIVRNIEKQLKKDYEQQKKKLLSICQKKRIQVDKDISVLSSKIIEAYRKY